MSILDQFSLKGKVALVTGGSGSYGQQIVLALADAGAQVIIASRDRERIERVAKEHRENGRNVIAHPLDQSQEASVENLRDHIDRDIGDLDILVNNAVLRPMTKGYQDDASAFTSSMLTNATGLFLVSRTFGNMMAERGSGSIINIGSIMGMVGPDPHYYRNTSNSPWYPDYFFHKGGMINYTRFLASYYGRSNVRCNCVSPGGLLSDKMNPTFIAQYSERTLLGRMAGCTDLMGAIVFLASDASAYITGANIPVDGGFTAK